MAVGDKWWNLDEGLTGGYSLIPHTLLCLLMDSKALRISEVSVLACLIRQTWGIHGRQAVKASARQIAALTNLNAKNVEQALLSLEEKGHVTIEREKGGASLVHLNFEAIRPAKEERKRSRKNNAAPNRPALYVESENERKHREAKAKEFDELISRLDREDEQRKAEEARPKETYPF